MDRLKQLETFAAVVSRGSLSAAAQADRRLRLRADGIEALR